jgi:hypothetical protein
MWNRLVRDSKESFSFPRTQEHAILDPLHTSGINPAQGKKARWHGERQAVVQELRTGFGVCSMTIPA